MKSLLLLTVLPSLLGANFTSPVEWSTSVTDAAGLVLTVTNTSSVPITALSFRTDVYRKGHLKGGRYLYFDSLVNVNKDRPILPGQTRAFTLIPSAALAEKTSIYKPATEPPAILMADNTNYGDAYLVAVIEKRRKVIRDDLARFVPVLEQLRAAGGLGSLLHRTLDLELQGVSQDKPQSRLDQDVGLVRGSVARFLKLTLTRIDTERCSTQDCTREYYSRLETYCRRWLVDLESLETKGAN